MGKFCILTDDLSECVHVFKIIQVYAKINIFTFKCENQQHSFIEENENEKKCLYVSFNILNFK